MDSYHLKWMQRQFPDQDIKKIPRLDLMSFIIAKTHEKLKTAVDTVSDGYYRDQFRRMGKTTARQIKLPDLHEHGVMGGVAIRKAKESGELISEGLRQRLTDDLRDTLVEHLGTQGTRMEHRGRIDPALVDRFERAITKTFRSYCRAEGSQMPPNIRTIAETEVRAVVSDAKQSYVSKLMQANPGKVIVKKRWIHHPTLSQNPRPGHAYMHGETVSFDHSFNVPVYSSKGKITHRIKMLHPHDPAAPIEEVANCHCECDYLTEIIPAEVNT